MRMTWPCRPAAVNGRELSQPVAPSREGILPSTGNWAAAGCVVARKSWLALLRNVVHSLASWSIGRSFKAGSRAGRSVRREPFDADELALDAEQAAGWRAPIARSVLRRRGGHRCCRARRRGRASPVVVVEG